MLRRDERQYVGLYTLDQALGAVPEALRPRGLRLDRILLRSVSVREYEPEPRRPYVLLVRVLLRRWCWLGLGLVHLWAARRVSARMQDRLPVGVRLVVRVAAW